MFQTDLFSLTTAMHTASTCEVQYSTVFSLKKMYTHTKITPLNHHLEATRPVWRCKFPHRPFACIFLFSVYFTVFLTFLDLNLWAVGVQPPAHNRARSGLYKNVVTWLHLRLCLSPLLSLLRMYKELQVCASVGLRARWDCIHPHLEGCVEVWAWLFVL